LKDPREYRDLLFRQALLLKTQRRIISDGIRSRHHMYKIQRGGSHSRGEDRDLLQLVHQIAPDHDLDRERQLRHVATSERAHQTIERSISAPAIVIFARYAIETKSNVRHSSAV